MSTPFHRRTLGGRIDRSRAIRFSFDGGPLIGHAGDTLASALLANGRALIGRSFKYHRPRGIVSAGVEEPNGLFTLGTGARREPNGLGTTTELVEGLVAESQNRWPSLRLDLMALNQLAAPMLGAGFYYKSFMGPTKKSWMTYEPLIRRAAGLGRASPLPDPDRYEGRHAFADVVVVGGGPAGIAAALSAGRAGARVLLVEQDTLLGGALLSEPVGGSAAAWLDERIGDLARLGNVEILTRASVFGLYDGQTLGVAERRDHETLDPARGRARQVVWTVRAKAVIFATGAIERPLVFNDNDRPGVMLASAVRSYLNRFAVAPGHRAVVVTNNQSAYRTAFDLAAAGLEVTVADLRRDVSDDLRRLAKERGIALRSGVAVTGAEGRRKVTGAVISDYLGTGKAPDVSLETLSADVIAMSGGWSPAVHLTSHLGVKPLYRPEIAAFVPGKLPPGQLTAGAVNGAFDFGAALDEGLEAGRKAAARCGYDAELFQLAPPALEPLPNEASVLPVWSIPGPRKGKAFVDLQNDVTVDDIALAHREGYQSVEHLKRYTTLGMGTDQGKTSNINALALMAGLREVEIPMAGTTTFRPPYTPVALGALAGRAVGAHVRPVRRSPLHAWHAANGATFIEAGPWLRAWYYAWAGSDAHEAYLTEMKRVRAGVGLSDVSTLGKIDVQGPDAAELLNRVYVNGFAKLSIGRARYGVMLADDGTVFDDGTVTRFGETSYYMTTTTAGAGEVMSWLEFLLQTAWTDLRVTLTSVTDAWGGMALAGPHARTVLARVFPAIDVSNEALPYMGALETDLDGVPLRIFRLSFSGELGYEVHVPADFTVAIWQHLLDAGAGEGIRPYGLEALASLRIEKGHVAGMELDHRNTLHDLGLSKMASGTKPFVGRELLQRPALNDTARWSLVGLECLEPDKRLRGGAILFAEGDEIKGHGRGYITAVTWSTELGKLIALALYSGGLTHEGREIVCAFPLKDEQVRARIVAPHFIDREGTRLHA